jgi:hypothetical protein
MMADREEVAAEATPSAEEVMKTMGLMLTRRVAIAPMARAIPITIRETLGINLSQHHAPRGAILMTW